MGRSIVQMQLERGRSIDAKHWGGLGEKELKSVVDEAFIYFRDTGLPFYSYSDRGKREIFSTLYGMDMKKLIRDGKVIQNYCGLGLANSYFPHMQTIHCRPDVKFKTVMETFNDDVLFRKALERLATFYGKVSKTSLRGFIKIVRKTQMVSNFRPSAAKAIYRRYADGKVVWDMSCGFGGRLLGAMACPVKKYIGTDPSAQTQEGLQRIVAELGKLSPTKVELHKLGSEDFVPAEPVDFCFTSPPYFNTEKYSDEPTQSYIKFPTMEKWLNGFVRQTVSNCRVSLRKGGHLALNISPKLEEPFMELCLSLGFVFVEKLGLELSYMPGQNRTAKTIRKKYEPILVFKR